MRPRRAGARDHTKLVIDDHEEVLATETSDPELVDDGVEVSGLRSTEEEARHDAIDHQRLEVPRAHLRIVDPLRTLPIDDRGAELGHALPRTLLDAADEGSVLREHRDPLDQVRSADRLARERQAQLLVLDAVAREHVRGAMHGPLTVVERRGELAARLIGDRELEIALHLR